MMRTPLNGKVAMPERPIELWRFTWLPLPSTQVEICNKNRSIVIYLNKTDEGVRESWPAGDPEKNPVFFSRGFCNPDTLALKMDPQTKYITNPEEFPQW